MRASSGPRAAAAASTVKLSLSFHGEDSTEAGAGPEQNRRPMYCEARVSSTSDLRPARHLSMLSRLCRYWLDI